MLVYIGESTGSVELRPQRRPGSATVHDLLPGFHKGCEKLRRNNLVILCVQTASDGYVASPRCRSSPYDASRVSVSMTPGSFESKANPDPRCSMAHCPVDREFSNLRPKMGNPGGAQPLTTSISVASIEAPFLPNHRRRLGRITIALELDLRPAQRRIWTQGIAPIRSLLHKST
jgi:hypothetical protein